MVSMNFGTFSSWQDVIAHVRAGKEILYHAPMDWRPVIVRCHVRPSEPDIVQVDPRTMDADPFGADSGHLTRFRRRV